MEAWRVCCAPWRPHGGRWSRCAHCITLSGPLPTRLQRLQPRRRVPQAGPVARRPPARPSAHPRHAITATRPQEGQQRPGGSSRRAQPRSGRGGPNPRPQQLAQPQELHAAVVGSTGSSARRVRRPSSASSPVGGSGGGGGAASPLDAHARAEEAQSPDQAHAAPAHGAVGSGGVAASHALQQLAGLCPVLLSSASLALVPSSLHAPSLPPFLSCFLHPRPAPPHWPARPPCRRR